MKRFTNHEDTFAFSPVIRCICDGSMSNMVGVYFDNFNMRHCFMFTMQHDKNNNAV